MPGFEYISERKLRSEYATARAAYKRPAWIDKVALLIEDAEDQARLPWIGGVTSGMKERTGQGQAEQANIQYVDIQVDEYENGVEIPYKSMRRDRVGLRVRETLMAELAASEARHWESMILAALAAGAATVGYDGQYVFDTDHADSGGAYTTNQANAGNVDISANPAVKTNSTTVPSVEDLVWGIAQVIQTMAAFRDNMGEYVNEHAREFVCFFPLTMWATAIGATKANLTGYGASNLLNDFLNSEDFKVQIVASPRLSAWTASFAVIRTDVPRKFLIGLEEELEPGIATKVFDLGNSDKAKRKEAWEMQIRRNRAIKAGDWRHGYLATLV